MPPATISEWTWPEKPWHRLHLDLAGPFMGRMFLVLVDAYSKRIEIFIKDITSKTIINHLREIFARFGLPEFVVIDNGRQFVSDEFEKFTKMNGIRHTKTSPYNPSTNGLAERYSFQSDASLPPDPSGGEDDPLKTEQ
ncbi:K02A2.6-like [Cordylochernes scorpioides]|uniref:K02A2.6-like n=1 Tax=Cordylochernes scorpioides TaxID=51811 RepID=A0ABY6LNA4_9ARAC|nr:K02A2.6-like [Cordylochernes scorpioides]